MSLKGIDLKREFGTPTVLMTRPESLYPVTDDDLQKILTQAKEQLWTALDLRNLKLDSIPPELGQLDNLQNLSLARNQLTSVPSELGQLYNLETLDLSQNQLTSAPPELGQLANLQTLDLTHNQLTSVPPELGKIANLLTLFLYGNQLTVVPPELGQLTNLQELLLSQNDLTSIPPELEQLTNLQTLDLSLNELTSVPPELGKLVNLQYLDLNNNPLTSPPPEVVAQGTKAVLAYLRRMARGKQEVWVSKLLLLGQGGVGKTSLLRRLSREKYNVKEDTTRGLHVGQLPIKHPQREGVTMTLNAWDFGGQDIYHANHQFFLTDRSLFVLVWNARMGYDDSRVTYWLDIIKARAPESPVIIVATWTDERDADIPVSDLQQRYPKIVGHYKVSNKTGAGMDAVRQAITATAAGLPLMGVEYPTSWLKAADALRALPDKHILPRRMFDIMTASGLTEQTDACSLARALHDVGDILWYQDDEELKQMVILKPQWVTDYVSRVLDDEETAKNDGVLKRERADKLWCDLDASMHPVFLRLMEKFDQSYRTLDNKEISYVVERLSFDPPEYKTLWDSLSPAMGKKEVSMRYLISSSFPPGIPTYFIARSHRFSIHKHWRRGALLADRWPDFEHLALVQASPEDRELKLTVRGPYPHEFFDLLRDGLEVTLGRFPGLPIERRVPCVSHDGSPCAYEYPFDSLKRAWGLNVRRVQCLDSFELVDVATLLLGLKSEEKGPVESKLEMILNELAGVRGDIAALEAIIRRGQMEFIRTFLKFQLQPETRCPNAFTLSLARMDQPKGDLRLHLWCQCPGQWHPTPVVDHAAGQLWKGDYLIPIRNKKLAEIAPIVNTAKGILKHVVKGAGAIAKIAYAHPLGGIPALLADNLITASVEATETVLDLIPDLSGERRQRLGEALGKHGWPEEVSGASMRVLRELLDEVDRDHHWGGLSPVVTKENHVYWLCDYHAKQYRD